MTTEQAPPRGIDPAASSGPEPAASGTHDLPADAIALIPLRHLVLFPGMIAPINLGRTCSIAAAQQAMGSGRPVGLLLQRDADIDAPQSHELFRTGTVATVLRFISAQDETTYLVCQGERRFRITEFLDGYPFLAARVQQLEDEEEQATDVQARFMQLRQRLTEVLALMPQVPAELTGAADGITSASALADFVAGLVDMPVPQKQALLETFDLRQRIDLVLQCLVRRIEVLRLSQEINEQTKERIDDRQREYLLREQLKTIRRELGEPEDGNGDLARLDQAIALAGMPGEVEAHARKELQRLSRMTDGSAEHAMLYTWLECMSELPWSALTEDRIDIAQARRILDDDHYGLHKIKRRILEHLAVRKLNPGGKSPILCFVGPPGVGKTSLGQSIARATGRKFVRVSLGGVHDEAEIRGHRRTYVGALPGNIIQAVRKAGSRNCVMMLDEIDKLSAGVHGDPSSAMLEVLDPEQNADFRDNYLGQPFDLSRIMFITTANLLDTIPGALLDRMEVLRLPGYTEEEKMEIARRYLVSRQLTAAGLDKTRCVLADEAVRALVRGYTHEAGVRNLEREIGNAVRFAAMRIAEETTDRVCIAESDLADILGPPQFESELALRTGLAGVATGLAWTPAGGDILFVEASKTPGSGKLILTGQLGDVMKESAQAALTLVKAHCTELDIDAGVFDRNDIHIHVPAGAMPKDGPSAGVAMYVALASLVRHIPVRSDCAMSGEISLRGLVLPVGGIKEKVLAALRAGIRTVMLPMRNRKDLDEIPEQARAALEIIWLETVDDALRNAMDGMVTAGETWAKSPAPCDSQQRMH